jgi:hypothetical protein
MKPSLVELEIQAVKAWVEQGVVCVKLTDEREIRFPASKNRRLRKATARQLANLELICDGTGLHWPDLDEDLSIQGILEGHLGQP